MLKLFRHLRPYTWGIIAILALVFLQTQTDLYLPTLMSDIINNGVMKGNTELIWRLGALMLLVAGFGALCAVLSSFLSAKAAMGFGRDLRSKVFRQVTDYSLHEFDKLGTSTLITRTTNDITQVQNVLIMMLRMMVMSPMMMIGGVVMAVQEDKALTWVLVAAMPLLLGVIVLLATKAMPLFKVMQTKIDRMNLVVREKLTGIRVIRAFNRDAHERERFEQANEDLTQNYIRVNRIMAFMMPAIMLLMNLTTLAILYFGIVRIDAGDMQIGSLMAFIQYAMQILFSMIMMTMMFIMVPRAQAAALRINEVLDTHSDIRDPKRPAAAADRQGHVEFRNVSFRYHGAEQAAIRNISFHAKPGEVTAIIGSTGSGKSTLVNLIPRFYDVEDGCVLIDGTDVREMTQETLRNKIGFVPQKALLFSGTVTDNIRFGKPDATDAEVRHAAEIAQAAEFLATIEGGYDHVIAQGGQNVSGGQKQRLAIARALVRKPEIYVFDDSFSALDFKTDARLRAALRQETADATVLIIAQRVGTVMDADRILVLDDGAIAGMGTHRELLESCSVYREIVSSQLSEEEIA